METKSTFYRYLHIYPGQSVRWANIPLHVCVALLFVCSILAGVHRILIAQTAAGVVEIVIFGLLLLALPLVYPALAWAAHILGKVLAVIGRGLTEGILDAYHVVKGDLLIDNPKEELFLKKLKEVVEVERPIPKSENVEEKIRYGIRIYVWKTLQEFLTPLELQTLHESMLAVRDNEPSRIVAVTSASDLTMIKARSIRMGKNDLYSLADNLCRMMKMDANKSFEIFSTLFPNIFGRMNPITFVKSMAKDNRYDKDGKPLANKFVMHLAKQTRDNIDAYLIHLYKTSQKSES